MKLTVTTVGIPASLAVFLLFAFFRLLEVRKRTAVETPAGKTLNAAGFGFFPGLAVWKLFEQATPLAKGMNCFEPLGGMTFITEEGRFAVSRVEMMLACLCFVGFVIWLIARKKDLPDNGDLFLTALCLWSLIRGFTESFRGETLLRVGSVNLTQILMFLLADAAFAVWTVRLDATQKNTASSVLEWIAVLSCEAVTVLMTAGVLSAGSQIGDAAVAAGCLLLCMLMMLPAGMDSRK